MKIVQLLFGLFLFSFHCIAQNDFDGKEIHINLSGKMPYTEQTKLLQQIGIYNVNLDSLWQYHSLGEWESRGWTLQYINDTYRISVPIKIFKHYVSDDDGVMVSARYEIVKQQTQSQFGINAFKKQSVFTLTNGKTRFYLPGYHTANQIILSGTFNFWDEIHPEMIKTDSGWIKDIALNTGKHQYKFIIDGNWQHDVNNLQTEDDLYGGLNSVYFVTNYTFYLSDYSHVKAVKVVGSFNDWHGENFNMVKINNHWELRAYVAEGTHAYRFQVDKNEILDPMNPMQGKTLQGSPYSLLMFGEKTTFNLQNYSAARAVSIVGDFNDWNQDLFAVEKNEGKWQITMALPKGNYQYKWFVDGNWILDPSNELISVKNGHENSWISIVPNRKFVLEGFENAQKVEIAGNFSDWQPISMKKKGSSWGIQIWLPEGKCLYKYVVDGHWILDPSNSDWEENEYGTGNSVLWF